MIDAMVNVLLTRIEGLKLQWQDQVCVTTLMHILL